MTQTLKRAAAFAVLTALLTGLLAVPAAAETPRFRDVPAGHWAADDIDQAVDAGLFQGREDGTFGLGQKMTRASFVAVLGRLFDWKAAVPAQPTFTDVKRGDWFYTAVETACANGAVLDQSETFRPADAVTREEMASMLIRCLGYEALSGLAQDLPLPFTDLNTNAGYIAVAYSLGLMTGFTDTSFGPDQPATREQAAVVVMRTLSRYEKTYPVVSAVVDGDGLSVEKRLDTAAIPAARLQVFSKTPRLTTALSDGVQSAARSAAKEAGAKALLLVAGDEKSLRGDLSATVSLLAEAAEDWDGLQLDIRQLTGGDKSAFTALVQSLHAALPPDKLLFVTAEAPSWEEHSYDGYDFAALNVHADRIILRVAAHEAAMNGFPVAPPEPLEEVYYALCTVSKAVDPGRLSLWLTTTGSLWTDSGSGPRSGGSVDAEALGTFLEKSDRYYSSRYEAAYAVQDGKSLSVVWYLDRQAVEARLQMARFLGVTHVALSDGGSVTDGESGSVSALWA